MIAGVERGRHHGPRRLKPDDLLLRIDEPKPVVNDQEGEFLLRGVHELRFIRRESHQPIMPARAGTAMRPRAVTPCPAYPLPATRGITNVTWPSSAL